MSQRYMKRDAEQAMRVLAGRLERPRYGFEDFDVLTAALDAIAKVAR